ncbi:hypothetical protein [Aquabacter cavernae]|uniref:hypothetical protein n=1 Tax=Aquabacter cavernae TaxID=2496029 RepID=UPI000F8D0D64|nr:hypothetical protein [Aquabacter cavernae]
MRQFNLLAAAACTALLALPAGAQASCLEEIVALQSRVKAASPAQAAPPTEAQSVGAQLGRQPTPSSVAAASGDPSAPVGPAAALNAAQNFQAAGNEAACLKAVNEARSMLDGK